MSDIVIQAHDLWKKYRLGVLGTGTLRHDLNRWWHRVRGKPDPYEKVDASRCAEPNGALSVQKGESSLNDEEVWVLRGVSFEVKRGEILGIIGRNGAGKSTLLKILSRVTAPTRGEVRVKGRIASLLEVGTGFHPELTGRENIFVNGAILGMTRAEIRKKLDEIVAFAEVEKFLDTPVKRYSSGMYVRLAFAVAAHLEPEILIVDEVLAVGDTEFQKKCLGKMGEVAGHGRTVLFVSHSMATVERLCHKTILLKRGELHAAGNTRDVIQEYLQRMAEQSKTFGAERSGNGELRFQAVFLKTDELVETENPISGQPLHIHLVYESRMTLRNVTFLFTIYNQFGTPVTHCSTAILGRRIQIKPGKGEAICSFGRLPLPLGTYRIAVAAQTEDLLHDHIPAACTFEVESSMFYAKGFVPKVRECAVMLEHNWRVEPRQPAAGASLAGGTEYISTQDENPEA